MIPSNVQDFPIPPEKLIKIAQKMLLEDEVGKQAEDFVAVCQAARSYTFLCKLRNACRSVVYQIPTRQHAIVAHLQDMPN